MHLVALIAILRMTSSTNGTVILTDGTVKTTTDGGTTFTTVAGPPGKAPVLLDDGTLVWFGRGRGSCGDVFAPTATVTARRAFAFACSDTAMGGKQSVDLLATSDAGATWKLRATARPDRGALPYFGHKEGLVFFNAKHGLAFGGTAMDALWVDETFDGGVTWMPSKTFFAQHGRVHVAGALQPIAHVLSSGAGVFALPFHVAGGIETDVFVTRDKGATWTEITPLTGVESIQALDATHLVALGADGAILRWDGGEWIESGKVAAGQRIWFRTYDEGWILDGDAITSWSP